MSKQAGTVSLTAAQITKPFDLAPVEIPELQQPDGPMPVVYVKQMTVATMLRFLSFDADHRMQATVSIVVDSIVDEDGKQVFKDTEEVNSVDVRIFTRMANAVTGAVNKLKEKVDAVGGEGNDSSEAATPTTPAASPIA